MLITATCQPRSAAVRHRAHVRVLRAAAQPARQQQHWPLRLERRRLVHEGREAVLLGGSRQRSARRQRARHCGARRLVGAAPVERLLDAPDAREQVDGERAAVGRRHELPVVLDGPRLAQLRREDRVDVAVGDSSRGCTSRPGRQLDLSPGPALSAVTGSNGSPGFGILAADGDARRQAARTGPLKITLGSRAMTQVRDRRQHRAPRAWWRASAQMPCSGKPRKLG